MIFDHMAFVGTQEPQPGKVIMAMWSSRLDFCKVARFKYVEIRSFHKASNISLKIQWKKGIFSTIIIKMEYLAYT